MTRGELTELVKQLMIDNESQQNEINGLKSEVSSLKSTTSIDEVYPVGSIYIRTSEINPSDLFKGTVSSTFKGTSVTSGATGLGTAFSVQNPYVVVYMWKRIA